jgi:hypothetical protein
VGWREQIVEFLFPGYTAGKVAEAIIPTGGNIDPDDDAYRRLTGGTRSLSEIEMSRAQAISLYLWRRNPMAKRMTEMLADFVVGDGITWEADEPDVQEVLDEFWHDPKMNLHLRHRDLTRDLSIYGEQAWRVFVNEKSGRVRIGYIDSSFIKDVVPNPDNALEDRTLVLKPPSGAPTEDIKIPIVTFDDEQEDGKDGDEPKAPEWSGEAFYFAVNRVTGQRRGTPDLLAVADFIDGYDQLLFNALERSGLINAFVWDVKLIGATKSQVDTWVQEHGVAPPPGAVRAHNDKEEWQAVAPTLGNADMMALGRPVKNMALGGFGAPEAWFAEGDSANRATLAAQGDPTYRMVTARQTIVGAAWTLVGGFVIAKAVEAGRLPINVKRDFRVIVPEPSQSDMNALATTLTALATSLVAAEEQKWISKQTARVVYATVLSGLGVEIDPSEEEERIDTETDEAEQEAIDAGLPTPDEQKRRMMDIAAQGQPVPEAPPQPAQIPAA